MSGTVEYSDPRTAAFRATLDRLPDEIALAIGLRVFDLQDANTCVCGWAMREGFSLATGVPAENIPKDFDSEHRCKEQFGGSLFEWQGIFAGVCSTYTAALIEEALFDRVMAAALAAEKPKSQRGSSRRGAGR